MNKFYKFGVICSIIGFFFIFLIFIFKLAHPNPLFNIFSALGLLFIFLSIPLVIISTIFDFFHMAKQKDCLGCIIFTILILINIIFFASKYFFR